MQRALLSAVFLAALPLAATSSQSTVPTVASGIGAAPARVARVEDKGDAAEIATKDGLRLKASYFQPKASGQPAPGAILVHDSGASRAQLFELAERLSKSGFAVLAIDLRGHGDSATKEQTWQELDAAEQKSLWALAVRDLEAASQWMHDRKEVEGTNLNVIGYRAGCALAARFALRDENVRSVVLVEPRAEELGINVKGDLTELGGLPTYIVSCKENSQATEAMIQEAHKAAGGNPDIELMICSASAPPEEPAIERKALASIAKWTKERAFPQK